MQPINSDLFICPQCSGTLQPGPAGSERLDCQNCSLSYPLRDGVPVLVIKQASARPVETNDEFERLVSEALQAPFSGWDFSWLEGRRVETPDPRGDIDMDYEGRARACVAKSTEEITAPVGLTSSTRSGLTRSRIGWCVTGEGDSMVAVCPSRVGRKSVSWAHQADSDTPATDNRCG